MAAFTALPRTKWAEIRKRLEENPVNNNILKLIDSAVVFMVLQSEEVDSSVSHYSELFQKHNTLCSSDRKGSKFHD